MSEDSTASMLADDTSDDDGRPDPISTPSNAPVIDATDTAWFKPLSAGLDDDTSKVWATTAGRYKDQSSFVKSHLEMRQNAIFLPKDDKPEAWDAVFNRLGRPEKPEYTWNHLANAPALEAGDQEVRNGFAPVAHRLGMTQKQVDGVVQWHDQQRTVGGDAMNARTDSVESDHMKSMQNRWKGDEFKRQASFHSKAVKAYAASPEDYKTLKSMRLDDGTFVMNHPAVVGMMAKVGAERAEDSRFADGFSSSARTSALESIAKIENDAMAKGLYPGHPAWPNEELKTFYARAHPGKVGASGSLV